MEISATVLKRSLREDLDRVAIDSKMLSVLLEVDGVRQVAEVGRDLGIPEAVVCEVARRLLEAKLVAPADTQPQALDGKFLEVLERELAIAIGPIAPIVLEDGVAEIGYGSGGIPGSQGAQLIERVAADIQREDKKMVFKQTMLQHLKSTV